MEQEIEVKLAGGRSQRYLLTRCGDRRSALGKPPVGKVHTAFPGGRPFVMLLGSCRALPRAARPEEVTATLTAQISASGLFEAKVA